MIKKLLIASIAIAAIAGFFAFDLHHWLTFNGLKSGLAQFHSWYAAKPLLVTVGFFALYVVVAALSLPGAAILTLAAGALFGLWRGTLLVSFASTIGATLAFLITRHLLREGVEKRFGDRLSAINQGLEKDGATYLFMLRLVPLFPFFLVNLLMGLTKIRTWTFYWVSQLGMLAGTLVYVNAGTQLASLESTAGILSPKLIASFVLLGIFPLLGKKFVGWLQARKVYAKYQRPAKFDRNLIVIGAGAGGLVTAYIAAAVKAKVTLIEAHKMGGDCLNYGCVPSKALIKSAKLAHQIRHADHYGLQAQAAKFSFRDVMRRVHEVIRAIEPHDSIERYTKLGVEVLQGYARLIDPWTVEIALNAGGTQRLTARSIVIAAGGKPFVPPLPGIEDVGYLTSDTLWESLANQDQAPQRMVVLGGGPIGCELAQSFARLGSQVSQVEMLPRLLVREDPSVSQLVTDSMIKDGIQVLTEYRAIRCERDGEQKWIVLESTGEQNKGEQLRIAFDVLLCAVGRVARLEGYGLETLGIETKRTIVTNEYLETLYPNIFAAGDVAGPFQFTHVAAHQAWYAAVNALFGRFKKFKVDYSVIPWTTFTDPEVARVGLNEQDAKERGIAVEVTTYGIDDLDRAICDGAAHGFVKILTPPGKDRILGATIVGEHAGELMAEIILAMRHGLGLNKILGTIHTYPTMAESNKYAAGIWKAAHAPQGLLRWVERFHAWNRG
jgi:pyruvate/2-oxoglutarate dehydrogenase complex dihydrolipoamide dehydrogenase (E3) component/uncharacterized membrane protein YdjX (TVP38/TMEM64 family)